MKKFIIKRLGLALISLFLLSLTIFLLMRVTGAPAVLRSCRSTGNRTRPSGTRDTSRSVLI